MPPKSAPSKSVFDKTLDNLLGGWRRISQNADAGNLRLHPDLPDSDIKRLRTRMRNCLESRGGEVSARARAADLGQGYLGLNDAGRYRFLRLMADEFGVDQGQFKVEAEGFLQETDPHRRSAILERARSLLQPPRMKLLTQFNALPSGVKFLVGMRADLLRFARKHPGLEELERDLKQLLVSWFDIGFLDLKRITWDEPASLLEKLITYEAVHEIRSWDDLKHRLDSDRRCYGYFHPRMPDEPLIFVQVALVSGMSENIQELLDDSQPGAEADAADTAIFYSISNTQPGLRGMSFGDFLIKRVVNNLSRRLPNLKTFATLSPIPGFAAFVQETIRSPGDELLSRREREHLQSVLAGGDPAWFEDPRRVRQFKPALLRLCAHYLLNEKKDHAARDAVANFHLTNGARVERINWLGDRSARGMKSSLGLMANYFYKLSHIERNHEAYVGGGEVAASSAVRSLLKK